MATQIDRVIRKLERTIHETNKQWKEIKRDEVLNICMTAIDHFYSWDPDYYDRLGSLHDLYKVSIKQDYISLMFDSDNMAKHRVDNEYIYDIVFYYGFHGGAVSGEGHPNPKNFDDITKPNEFTNFNQFSIAPYWRTGVGFTRWGKRARKSNSPYWEIRNCIDELNKSAKDRLNDIFRENARKYLL